MEGRGGEGRRRAELPQTAIVTLALFTCTTTTTKPQPPQSRETEALARARQAQVPESLASEQELVVERAATNAELRRVREVYDAVKWKGKWQ